MKANYIILSVVFALLSSSCIKDKDSFSDSEITFYASGESDTRTALDQDGGILWSPRDEVKFFYKNGIYKFVSANNSETEFAELKGSFGTNRRTEGDYVVAVYPYSVASYGYENGGTVALPAIQQGMEGSFVKDLFPSVARSTDNYLSFKCICGGLTFTVGQEGIKKIVFSGNDGESLAGTLNFVFVDAVSHIPTVTRVDSAEKKVTLLAPDNGTFKKGQWYYMVLVPQKLKKGYTIEFYSDKKIGETVSNKSVTISRAMWGVLHDIVPRGGVKLEAVDLGLPVKWANINLGAKALNDYGDYYSWGETSPEDGYYSWSNYMWGSPSKFSKYAPSQGKTQLDPEDDAAVQNLGGHWRMATIEEFTDLVNKCTWEKTTIDNVTCYKVSGNGHYIYIPAYPGYYDGRITERGVNGYYWSSTIMYNSSTWQRAQNLWFKGGVRLDTGERFYGEVIRPVYDDRVSEP